MIRNAIWQQSVLRTQLKAFKIWEESKGGQENKDCHSRRKSGNNYMSDDSSTSSNKSEEQVSRKVTKEDFWSKNNKAHNPFGGGNHKSGRNHHTAYLQAKARCPNKIVELDGCSSVPVCNDKLFCDSGVLMQQSGRIPNQWSLLEGTCFKSLWLHHWKPLISFSLHQPPCVLLLQRSG